MTVTRLLCFARLHDWRFKAVDPWERCKVWQCARCGKRQRGAKVSAQEAARWKWMAEEGNDI